jgi:hypothetical protein
MATALFTPFSHYWYIVDKQVLSLDAFGLNNDVNDIVVRFPYYVPIFASLGLSMLTIAKFKDRKKQLLFGKINYLAILLSIVFIMMDVTFIAEQLSVQENYYIGAFLPVAALPFIFLANRAIKKDEKLIKSLDRLR